MQAQQLWHQLDSTAWGSLVAERLSGAARSTGNVLTGYVPSVASSALGIGGSFVVVVATGLFLAATPELYLSGGLRLLPIGWRPRGRDVAVEIAKTLRLWFFGQFIDMVIVTTLVGAGLFLLDVQLALTLALFAGLLNFVPMSAHSPGQFRRSWWRFPSRPRRRSGSLCYFSACRCSKATS